MKSKPYATVLPRLPMIVLAGLLLFLTLLVQPQRSTAQDASPSQTLQSFAGSWKGVCADGEPFILLTLHVNDGAVSGTVSIANMNGNHGQCVTVLDSPSPDHAMKIADAQLNGKILAFKGSEHAQFQMTIDADGARLKFLGTPVEQTPWKLTRTN